MHILLGLLATIVTVLYLLSRLADMGINLGGLNPFYWRRRRAWRNKYEGDPIFAIEDPMEIAALLVVGIAKLDGDMSSEQKQAILAEFEGKFSLGSRDASQLLGSSAHLLSHPQLIRSQIDGLVDRNRDGFSAEQAESLLDMMTRIASSDGAPTDQQIELLDAVRAQLAPAPPREGVWDRKA